MPLFVTFIAGLFLGLDYGIIVGVALNVLFILQKTARPKVSHEITIVGSSKLMIITPDQSLFFSSSEYFRSFVTKQAHLNDSIEWIIINGHYINHLDATVATGLDTLSNDLGYLKKTLIFWKWNQQPLGVLYRTNPQFLNNFKHSDTVEELINELDRPVAVSH